MIDIDFFRNLVYFIGIYALIIYLVENLKSVISIVKTILEPFFIPNAKVSLLEKYGNWAVVTGSTDGIGREYARELAKRGINIVLISRTKEKLEKVAHEIETDFDVKTKYIVADFSKGQQIFQSIENELSGIPIGILVNNVGKMYDYPEELQKVPEQVIWDIININVGATTAMSRMVIKQMKIQEKGVIVNISSGSELQPLPNMAVYAATKSYIKSLTLAMQHELSPYNIDVQLVTPLFLVTKMNGFSETVMKGGLFIPNVQSYTKWAVFTLGKSSETTGYWAHGLQYAFSRLVPMALRTWIGLKLTSSMKAEYLRSTFKEM